MCAYWFKYLQPAGSCGVEADRSSAKKTSYFERLQKMTSGKPLSACIAGVTFAYTFVCSASSQLELAGSSRVKR